MVDTDDEVTIRRSKRHRADFRPSGGARSDDDGDAMQSSPGRSQRGHSRDDVPMTNQTDDDPYEVPKTFSIFILWFGLHERIVLPYSEYVYSR